MNCCTVYINVSQCIVNDEMLDLGLDFCNRMFIAFTMKEEH